MSSEDPTICSFCKKPLVLERVLEPVGSYPPTVLYRCQLCQVVVSSSNLNIEIALKKIMDKLDIPN